MNHNVDALQFSSLAIYGVSVCLIIGCIATLYQYQEKEKWRIIIKKVLLGSFAIQLLYGAIATTFYQKNRDSAVLYDFKLKTKEAIENKNKIGICISNPAYKTTYTIDPRICQYCNFLKQVGEGFWVNQINIPLNTEEMEFKERATAVRQSPFYKYAQALKKENKFTTSEDAAIKFINQYKVDFCVVEKGAIVPEKINSCVRNKITDPYSGTTLLFFNRPCSLTNF
jgi:hypothetical protein